MGGRKAARQEAKINKDVKAEMSMAVSHGIHKGISPSLFLLALLDPSHGDKVGIIVKNFASSTLTSYGNRETREPLNEGTVIARWIGNVCV